MLVKTIGKKYASALYHVAKDSNRIAEIKESLETFISCMSKDAYSSFKNPKLSLDAKQADLRKRTENKIPAELLNFLCLLIEKKRFEFLPEITLEFKNIYDEMHGFKKAQVTSAFEVTKAQQEKVRTILEKRYRSKFLVGYSVDTSLIGGMIIKIGNEMIDGSIKNQLAKVKALLLS